MRNTDDASSQKEVIDIATVQAAIRNLIDAAAVPLVAAGFFAENAIRRVKVHRPAAMRYGIRMQPLLDHVALREHIIAFKTSAFALAGDMADPFKRQRLGFGELT